MNPSREQAPTDPEYAAQRGGPDGQSHPAMLEHVAIPPTLFDIACVTFEHFALLDLAHVVKDVSELHPPEPLERGTVRIPLFVRERMMLPMDRHPLFCRQPGRQPEDEFENPLEARMKDQRSMGRRAVEINC